MIVPGCTRLSPTSQTIEAQSGVAVPSKIWLSKNTQTVHIVYITIIYRLEDLTFYKKDTLTPHKNSLEYVCVKKHFCSYLNESLWAACFPLSLHSVPTCTVIFVQWQAVINIYWGKCSGQKRNITKSAWREEPGSKHQQKATVWATANVTSSHDWCDCTYSINVGILSIFLQPPHLLLPTTTLSWFPWHSIATA